MGTWGNQKFAIAGSCYPYPETERHGQSFCSWGCRADSRRRSQEETKPWRRSHLCRDAPRGRQQGEETPWLLLSSCPPSPFSAYRWPNADRSYLRNAACKSQSPSTSLIPVIQNRSEKHKKMDMRANRQIPDTLILIFALLIKNNYISI